MREGNRDRGRNRGKGWNPDGGAGRFIWTTFLLFFFVILLLLFIWKAVPVLLLIFAGSLFALALRFISDTVSRWTRIPPLWSLTTVLVLVIGGMGIAGTLAFPALATQFRELAENLRESLIEVEDQIRSTPTGQKLLNWLQGMGEEWEDGADLWEQLAGIFTTTFGALAGFFLTLIIGVFFAYNPCLYIAGFLRMVPMNRRQRAAEILTSLGDTLRWWMAGQLISMLFLAVTTWLMLWFMGIPLAFTLGLVTGALTFVPYLGPLAALLPIMLIAFVESPTLALYVLVLYLVIQNIESNVLMPIIFQKTVHLPPVLTIVAQILLGTIFGLVGVILATPLMAAGIVLVKMIYVHDVIGDSMRKPVKELRSVG